MRVPKTDYTIVANSPPKAATTIVKDFVEEGEYSKISNKSMVVLKSIQYSI